ncbi:hypothetical protein AB1287_03450 [Enterobacter asburiae]|uniref:hypothetical protein n=1 Tax=Scandinavium sp. UTDF21-P1B TaxID=3446379 RepID=UPI0034854D75
MLSPVSYSNSVTSIQNSPQGKDLAITAKLNLLEEKLNSIDPNKTTYEIKGFKDFFNQNKNKIHDISKISDKQLSTSLHLVNSINDNIALGEDNTENSNQLNKLREEIESILNSSNSGHKSFENRVKEEIDRSASKVGKEIQRTSERVATEIDRNVNKVKKGIKKFKF